MRLTLDQLQTIAGRLARQLAETEAELHQLREALEIATGATPTPPELRQMHEAVLLAARETGIGPLDIYSRCRRRPITRARWRAIELAAARGLSKSAIARAMGIDHTSVMHALRSIHHTQNGDAA